MTLRAQQCDEDWRFRRAGAAAACGVVILCLVCVLLAQAVPLPGRYALTARLFWTQDLALAGLLAAALFATSFMPEFRRVNRFAQSISVSASARLAACAVLALACYAGHYFLLAGWDFSRDEQMAVFDAWIFANGRLNWPIELEWRELVDALNTTFIVPIEGGAAWMSGYLPGNAMVRALVTQFADPALVSPLWTAIGAAALFSLCEKLWPGEGEAKLVAFALFAGSAQIILTGMTAYAMSAHMALNVLWLRAFIENSRRYDALALAIGFFASGLHQVVFHPMFAAPILCLTLVKREWARAGYYLFGYVLIGAFWTSWPHFAAQNAGGGIVGPQGAPTSFVLAQFAAFGPDDLALTAMNALRAVTWQHVLLLPLFFIGACAARRSDGLFAALVVAVMAPFPVMALVLAWQGVGWGYRYEHHALGAAILVAVLGWRRLRATPNAAPMALFATTVFSIGVMLPIQAGRMAAYYQGAAAVDRAIEATGADIAVIDTDGAPFGMDLVVNRPDLSNRPIRLARKELDDGDLVKLCRAGARAVFISAADFASLRRAYGLEPAKAPASDTLKAKAAHAGCRIIE